MSRTPFHERARRASPYAGFILAGLACIVCVSLSTVGRQGLGWLVGADLSSNLRADYNVTPNVTLPAVDPTRLAEIQATDEAALTITPGAIATVPIGRITPRSTFVALVTGTPAATPFPTSTDTPPPTQTPAPSATPTQIVFPTAPASFTPAPITPSPTNTSPPPATDTPTGTPTNTSVPPTDTPASPPPPATNTFTPSPSPTTVPSRTPTSSATATSTATPSPTTNPPPQAPITLTIVNTSTTLLSLVWSNESAQDADFAQYRVFRSTTMGGPYTEIASTGILTAYVDTNLTMGQTYYYVVRGEDAAPQQSPNSPEASGIPSAISDPNPNPINCGDPNPPFNCTDIGQPPNGIITTIDSTQVLTLDLGLNNGILNGPGWDFVYYEKETPPAGSNLAQIQWIMIELSMNGTDWQTAYAWSAGSESLAQNSNIAPFAIPLSVNGGINPVPGYCDLQPEASELDVIQMQATGACPTWQAVPEGGLYGTLPYKTGIAINIGGVIPPPVGQGYRYIRITQRPDATDPVEIDAIERLN